MPADTSRRHHNRLDFLAKGVDTIFLPGWTGRRYQKYGSMQIALHDLVERGDRGTMPVLIKLRVAEEDIDKETVSPDDVAQGDGVITQTFKTQHLARPLQATELLRTVFNRIKHPFPDAIAESG
jgi:hypothetical protein